MILNIGSYGVCFSGIVVVKKTHNGINFFGYKIFVFFFADKGFINLSFVAWYTDNDKDNEYEMTIAQEGGVIANENSSYLCCDVACVSGLENLYTDTVTNMTSFFYQYGQKGFGGHVLELGDYFNTTNVIKFDNMFSSMGHMFNKIEVNLGKSFDVSNARSSSDVFHINNGNVGISKIIVPNESVEKWVRNNVGNITVER